MIMISDPVADTDFDTDFCPADQDAAYYEDLSYRAQDCAESQLYVWGD